jgi:hypothetical protein
MPERTVRAGIVELGFRLAPENLQVDGAEAG